MDSSAHPLAGTWIVDLARSRRHENHQFHSLTMTFEVVDNHISLLYEGVNAAGEREASTRRFCADGNDHSIPEAPGYAEMTTLGTHFLDSVGKKDGARVGSSRYEVSEDGETLTATVSGTDASGRPFDQVIVFARK